MAVADFSYSLPRRGWRALWFALRLWFLRIAASGCIPARWFGPPPPPAPAARRGRVHIEIVSHCWNYSHMLIYQLSALVLHPPRRVEVTLTVFHAPEDKATAALLAAFAPRRVAGVNWNFQQLSRERLFRRSIGRNQAALASRADWIWFTDCDLVCHAGCLDALGTALQGRRDVLVYPRQERVTALLAADDTLLGTGEDGLPREIPTTRFEERRIDRATGPLQITHGDVARAMGYCAALPVYQEPMPQFAKCHEDRAFRWLLRSEGVPIDVPGVYRIRHQEKGRYQSAGGSAVRKRVRRLQEWLRSLR